MPDGVFAVEVVTPERRLVDGSARAVVLRSSEGDLTVLDGHTPLIADIVPGEVRVDRPEGDPVRLAVHGGYLQVGPEGDPATDGAEPVAGRDQRATTRVTVLAGVAELADEIDPERAEQAREQAERRVEELRAAVAAGGAPGAPGSPGGAAGDAGPAPTAEERQLAQAEAALRRAEVRLQVASTH
ncbi:MAG TPA: hypothetical protein VGL60_05475 [Acidimicrobiales bacterium]|jgi:F-type H+-transporting ATPase subunit epsilon